MYNILIDYLTMSFKMPFDSEGQYSNGVAFKEHLVDILHFPVEAAQAIKSHFGLSACIFYEGFQIHWEDDLVILDASGVGCRTIEELNKDYGFDWFRLFQSFYGKILSGHVKISRLDAACDVVNEKYIKLLSIIRCTEEERFVCKSDYYYVNKGNHERAVYFGSPKSNRRLRIYDKKLEQNDTEFDSWIRFEFQLRNENAISFILNWVGRHGDIVSTYYGILFDYIRFLNAPKTDVNHSCRIPTIAWWEKFIGGAPKLSQIYLPGRKYTLQSVADYWNNQCRSTAKLLWCVSELRNDGDISVFYDEVMSAKLSKKQSDLFYSFVEAKC